VVGCIECCTVVRRNWGSHHGGLVLVHSLCWSSGNFVQSTLPQVCFGRHPTSCWSLLFGVCAWEIKNPTWMDWERRLEWKNSY